MSNSIEEIDVSEKRARVSLRIFGEVQGVGFRFFVRKVVKTLDVSGWVRNEDDGTVSLVAEGSVSDLNELLEKVNKGPAAADVEDVEASWSTAFGDFDGFHVKLW